MMLNVLSAGFAYPPHTISNDLILGLQGRHAHSGTLEKSAPRNRYSVLDPNYLERTANRDLWEARKFLSMTNSELGAAAARMALTRAGIEIDQVGLLLGDTISPFETCPAEATRIGQLLNLKAPAYDLTGLFLAPALFLQSLAARKQDRLPDYILCVSTNTPTHYIRFDQGDPAYYFGDGAGAVVLSPRHAGPLVVTRASSSANSTASETVIQGIYEHLSFDAPARHSSFEEELLMLFDESQQASNRVSPLTVDPSLRERHLSDTFFIQSHFNHSEGTILHRTRSLPQERMLSTVKESGVAFGATPFAALALHWERIIQSAGVNLLVTGGGSQQGVVVLTAQEI